MDPSAAAALFDRLDPPLWLLTARHGPRRGGLIATFVGPASIVPDLPRVVLGLACQHYTWELVEASGAFALHLLGEDNLPWVWHFGLRSGRTFDKLEGLDVRAGATGSPLVAGALGWLDCRVEARLDSGDRILYLAEVVASESAGNAPPLTLQQVLERAPADKRSELGQLRARDSAVDAAAIRAWRRQRLANPAAIRS